MPESQEQTLATLDSSLHDRLPQSAITLFEAKEKKHVSFAELAKLMDRSEVAVAALFFGQTTASKEDIAVLAKTLELDEATLHRQIAGFPDRGRTVDMPPRDPTIYRLYEIVQNYGYAYKAVINEKFGDGIMSAIAFSTHVDKETDDKGVEWVNIQMRGKWLPFTRF